MYAKLLLTVFLVHQNHVLSKLDHCLISIVFHPISPYKAKLGGC